MHRRKKVDEKSCVTPAGTSNEFDVQNEWEENTNTQHCTAMHQLVVVVVIPFILDVRFADVPAGVTQDFSTFCGACLKLSREKDSAVFLSLVDRQVKFCVLTI